MANATGMFIRKLCLLSGVLLYCFFPAGAQDLEPILSRDSTRSLKERIFEGKPFDIAGSLSLSLRSYSASGIENRQSPFSWFIAGQTNISIYKINIPFSALISAQSSNFNHPFNQSSLDRRFARIGMSPYYKWIKVHAGHRSMHLSPLTVANHVFLGGGVELTPGKIRFATFYGKMTKTEPRDLALNQPNLEIFRRTGGGLKIGYGDNQNFIDLIAFKAMDDPNQINPL
ncbi:MAG TPA: hypothetical protein PKC40_13185, partial [Saprospiraceae bacterium]|nr:hypothetical protein [Saprospiraceae bacterium]